uniref:Uncharacterized protein n=1 Tax=Oryza brachyantha TaxID=4533 RepID=J3L7C6_ORYBR
MDTWGESYLSLCINKGGRRGEDGGRCLINFALVKWTHHACVLVYITRIRVRERKKMVRIHCSAAEDHCSYE